MNSVILALHLGVFAVVADALEESSSDCVSRGMDRFRENQVAESLRHFGRAIELDPKTEPYLWQKGISHYYAREFKKGRRQFEIHQQVNPHDVENAAWHFLCVAKIEGLKSARKALLRIDVAQDRRVPMLQVYELYAGRGTAESVIKASEKASSQLATMYAHLYLGLYYEVSGKRGSGPQPYAPGSRCETDEKLHA